MNKRHFSFNSQGQFSIMQLTDIHYCCDGSEADQRTLQLLNTLLTYEKSDLVVMTGDFLTGDLNTAGAAALLEPIIRSGSAWAYVFGNHDAEYGEDHDALNATLGALPGCVNPPSAEGIRGKSNFVLTLGDPAAPQWLLVGLDSGMYNENPLVEGYDYLHRDQIDWYVRQLTLRAQAPAPFGALAFFHIPLPEYNDVWNAGRCGGEKLEDVCCPNQNSGMFSAMVEEGHTRGTFVGHDHINDYDGLLQGIRLCYGRASGYNTYSRQGYQRGCRMITLSADTTDRFTTRIRLENGTVIDEIDHYNAQAEIESK